MKECESIFQKALNEGRSSLLIHEAQQICKLHNIPTQVSHVVQNVDKAVTKGDQIGFPVVLKVISPQILHKSDVGGVVLGIDSEAALKEAYPKSVAEVRRNDPEAKILGVLIEKMMPPSTEVIVGGIRDSQFGPSVMFGMGGIFTEVYGDVAFRVAPIDKIDVLNLIHELRDSKILEGIRGKPPAVVACALPNHPLVKLCEMMISMNTINKLLILFIHMEKKEKYRERICKFPIHKSGIHNRVKICNETLRREI